MAERLKANDVMRLIFENEDAGVVSEDEPDDHVELGSDSNISDSNDDEKEENKQLSKRALTSSRIDSNTAVTSSSSRPSVTPLSSSSSGSTSTSTTRSIDYLDINTTVLLNSSNTVPLVSESSTNFESHPLLDNIPDLDSIIIDDRILEEIVQTPVDSSDINRVNKEFVDLTISSSLKSRRLKNNNNNRSSPLSRRRCLRSSANNAITTTISSNESSSSSSRPAHQSAVEYVAKNNFKWSSTSNFKQDERTNTFEFKLNEHLKDVTNPFEFFDHLITPDMIEMIVEFTNGRLVNPHGRSEYIKSITVVEMRAYFGLLLLFGVLGKNDVEIGEIWSPSSVHHCDLASAAMPRERFKLISSIICFDDRSTRPYQDFSRKNFFKIDNIFSRFRENISRAVIPGENLTVDETLYAFRGHCNFRQYIKSKPARYGIKYWSIVDNQTSYLLDSEIYLGKQTASSIRQQNVGYSVVKRMCQRYCYSNRTVTADNFFSSINLAQDLWDAGLHYIGTIRANKPEVPPQFLLTNTREIGSSMFGFSNELTLVSYVPKRNKAVLVLSSKHHDESLDRSTGKPALICYYNRTKGGVDTTDKLIETYSCRRKTNRWPVNVFFYILDAACLNSFILARESPRIPTTNSTRLRRIYIEELCKHLILPLVEQRNEANSLSNYRGIQSPILESYRRVGVEPYRRRSEEIQNNEVLRRCDFCDRRETDRKTRFRCERCHRFTCSIHRKPNIICQNCHGEDF